jgi:antitoxin MazE
MEAVVRKWGNSPAIRIPIAILKETGFSINQPVEIAASKDKIIIARPKRRRYSLGRLLAGVTKENRHDPVDLGRPVGKERL